MIRRVNATVATIELENGGATIKHNGTKLRVDGDTHQIIEQLIAYLRKTYGTTPKIELSTIKEGYIITAIFEDDNEN